MDDYDWTPEFLIVARIAPEDPDEVGAPLVPMVIEACKGFPGSDESFVDLLDGLLSESLKRRTDTGASAPCKAYGFVDNAKGEEDRRLLEEGLLMATDLDGFRDAGLALIRRLADLPGAVPGLAVVMSATLTDIDAGRGVKSLAVFDLPYQDAQQVEHTAGLSLVDIPEVIVRKQARSMLYPLFGGDEPRHDLVKIHSRPAAAPFPGVLSVRPPPTTEVLLQQEVARALYSGGSGAEPRYSPYFEKPPAKKRELFGEERLVRVQDLLPPTRAAAVARESSRTTRDLYDKDQKLSLVVDDQVKIDARADSLGEAVFFAEHGGDRYMVIKGKKFVTNKAQLSSLDFLKVESLQDVLTQLQE
jgi:hypothetical protein